MPKKTNTGTDKRRIDENIYAGIATLGTIGLFSLVSRTEMSPSLNVAMFCFSIAWPLSASIFMTLHFYEPSTYEMPRNVFVVTLGVTACLLTLVGVAAIFAHFSWVYVVTFTAAAVASLIIFAIESGNCYDSVPDSNVAESMLHDNSGNRSDESGGI